jgi:general secretion pathway protein N
MRALRWILGSLGMLALAAGLLAWFAPAELALRFFGDRLGPVRLQGVSGSAWQGRAEQLIAFDVTLGPVAWTLARGDTLAGKPRGTLDLAGSAVRARGAFAREGAEWRFEGVQAELPAALLAPALDIPALGLRGRVVVDAPEAVLRDGLLARARGHAEWRDLGVTGAANATLPGVRIDFAPAPDGAIVAEVRDLGGPLEVAGEVRIKDGAFLSETRLHLREPNPQLEEALKFIGQRTPEGGSYLRIEGQLHRMTP